MTNRPFSLEVRNTGDNVCVIYADINFEPNCGDFTMKKGFQPILYSGPERFNRDISYDPPISFEVQQWTDMLKTVYNQMVALWNGQLIETMKFVQLPNQLVFLDRIGAGFEIYAHIAFDSRRVTFVDQKGIQPINYGEKESVQNLIGYAPWIQFRNSDWDHMVKQTYIEMVDLWNAQYAFKSTYKVRDMYAPNGQYHIINK